MSRNLRNILVTLVFLAVASTTLGAIPGDQDGDRIVSQEELENARTLLKEGNITSEQLDEIEHISESYPRRVVDSLENEIVIYKPVKSIIAPNSNAEELLRSILAHDKIVAVSDSTKNDPLFFPELSKLPSIGSIRDPDSEKMLELNPDLMILSAQWD